MFLQDGTVSLYHDAIPGLMGAMRPPGAMEYRVTDRNQLKQPRPGQSVEAIVRRQGSNYVLEDLKPGPPKQKTTTGAVQ